MKKTLLVVFILLLADLLAFSQSNRVFLDQLGVDDGLSQSEVRCILKDSKGYMWFGTGNGLNRYDGYQITSFKNDPFNPKSLPNDEIMAVADAGKGQIWVGTADGIGRLDPSTGGVRRLPEFAGQKITALAVDPFGSVWVATMKELVQIVLDTNHQYRLVHYRVGFSMNEKPAMIRTILVDRTQNQLWIGSSMGLARLVLVKPAGALPKRIQHIPLLATPTAWQLPHSFVLSMARDTAGTLWVATPEGVVRLHANTGAEIPTPTITAQAGSGLVSSLLIDRTQTLWMSHERHGILRFDLRSAQQPRWLGTIQQDIFAPKSLKSGNVLRLYEGPGLAEDIVWIGTYDAGVHIYSRAKNSFRLWPMISNVKLPSTAGTVFSICTDYNGDQWFGTYSGLLRVNASDQKQERYMSNPKDPFSLGHDFVNSLLLDRHNTLWVGTAVGLQQYDRKQNRFEFALAPTTIADFIQFQPIYSLFEDRAGRLWVGGSRSLRCLDPKTGKLLATYQHEPGNPRTMQLQTVSAIREDAQGQLWIGTWVGLYRLNPATGAFTHYTYQPTKPNGLLSNQIMGLMIDKKQQLWICSSKGLSRLMGEKGGAAFQHYQQQHGLPNSMVYGVLEDTHGRLWMSTNYGLACLDPNTGRFQNYDANDGLLTNEFNMGAYYRAPSGEFFFGGIGNAVSFNPTRIVNSQHQATIRITSFRVFDKVLNVDSLLAQSGQVVLQPADAFFTVGFTSLDYTHPQKNQYAYQLEGLQDEWVSSGNRRYVSFIDLTPGDYVLKVKGATQNGFWHEAGMLRLPIRILPPFWRTWWFYMLVFTGLSMLAWIVYTYRVRKRIETALEIERVTLAENERVRRLAAQDLHDEFGNTITRISMLTELIRAQLNGHATDIDPLLTKISDNSNRLYQGTKDFIWAINPEHDNLYEVAIRIKDFGDDVFDKTGISFQTADVSESLRAIALPMGASRHLIFLFKEAMSNTLKHAAATSTRLWIEQSQTEVLMHWSDNGVGIKPSPAYMGNGLLNMQSRAKRVGGQVEFNVVSVMGTTVTFRMPITQNGV